MMNSKQATAILHRLMAIAALALLVGALACAPPNRTDYSPEDEVNDNVGPPSLGDDDDSGESGDDTGTDDDSGE